MLERTFVQIKPVSVGKIAAPVVLLLVGYWLFGNPDVSFRSSDSKWEDGEVGFKGRRLDTIAIYFEVYKLSCSAPNAIFVRTTPRNWVNIFAWPNYLTDRKWRVPYSDARAEIVNRYPSCYSDDQFDTAKDNARKYLDSL